MCLGIKYVLATDACGDSRSTDTCSLAWAELRLTFAHTMRKFDLSLNEPM
jgi:hypothetical protein